MSKQDFFGSQTISFTSAATPGTNVIATQFKLAALSKADIIHVEATLTGATGGVTDVYLQRLIAVDQQPNEWRDWAHFPQLTVAQAATGYQFACDGSGTLTIQSHGVGTDAAPNVALAAGSYINVMPGNTLRIVVVSGASTSAGGAMKIRIYGRQERF